MDVQEILTSVQREFGDEAGVQLTEADVIRWINQGMRQIVMQNENLLLVEAVQSTLAGIQSYPEPVDLLILKGVHYRAANTTQYLKLKGYELSTFNEIVDGWDGSTEGGGVPVAYTVVNTSIKLWPVPSSTIASALKVYYNRSPVDVTATSDTPELPLLYHDALVKHCMLQAYKMDEDWDAAGNQVADLDRDINTLRGRESWKIQGTYSTITVLPDDAW